MPAPGCEFVHRGRAGDVFDQIGIGKVCPGGIGPGKNGAPGGNDRVGHPNGEVAPGVILDLTGPLAQW